MTTENNTAEKATRKKRGLATLEKSALSLDLKERVDLRNKLTESIDGDLKEMEEKLAYAKGKL